MKVLRRLRNLDWSRWLRAEPAQCPVCRRAFRPSALPLPVALGQPRRELGALCPDCADRIPWIHAPLCRVCGRPERCEDCRRRRETHFVISRSAVRYDEMMREWLALYKYRGAERLEPVLAAMLAGALERMAAELGFSEPGMAFGMVTAVPLSNERLAERGFNQAESMARRLASWYGIPFAPLLRRIRHTEKMSFKSRSERLTDVRGIFAPDPVLAAVLVRRALSVAACARRPSSAAGFGRNPPVDGNDRNLAVNGNDRNLAVNENDRNPPVNGNGTRPFRRILIVDDVYTTGSTMNEASRVLKCALGGGFELFGLTWARS